MSVLKSSEAAARVEVTSIGRRRWRWLLTTPAGLLLSVLFFVGSRFLDAAGAPRPVSDSIWGASVAVFALTTLAAFVRTVGGLVEMVWALGRVGDMTLPRAAVVTLGNLAMTVFGLLVGYLSTINFSRGRQLRRRGRVLLPSLRANGEWTTYAGGTDMAAGRPPGLADQWRENGKTEHASVAAFARLTLDLMALGAPPDLIAAANQDALDEIRHAEMCFSWATALDGRRASPAPFPEAQRVATLSRIRSLALARLAVSSLVDGALHEGVSARIITRLAKRCESPALRDMLKSIAADEGRHSAHGWSVVEWCLEQGGAGIAEALLGAIRALPRAMRSALPPEAADGGWERWGIHGHALEAEEYGAALTYVVQRVQRLANEPTRTAA